MLKSELPSYITNILPGGKYHAMAVALAAAPGAMLQNRVRGGEWYDATASAYPFNNCGEFRIKPKVQTAIYRVALLRYAPHNKIIPYIVVSKEQEGVIEDCGDFVRWATDWVTEEVES